jgi:hypothetical protein
VSDAEAAQDRRMHRFGVVRSEAAGDTHTLDGSSSTQNPLVLDSVRATKYQAIMV